MEVSQIEAFVAVVEEKGFSRAAARLLRTQPAVSQAVKRLEEWLNEPLLDRSSKSGELTEAGKLVYDYSKQLLNLRLEARSAVEELKALERGSISIGANESTALYLLPVLQQFRRRFPRVRIAVKRTLSREIPTHLMRHEIDLGVLSYDPRSSGLESKAVSIDELTLIVPPGHALGHEKQVSIRELGGESFIAHNVASPYRQHVIEAFARFRTTLKIGVELPTVETIKKGVRAGMGVAFVPRMCIEDELARGELSAVRVRELRIQRKLRVVYRRKSVLSPPAQEFLKLVKPVA